MESVTVCTGILRIYNFIVKLPIAELPDGVALLEVNFHKELLMDDE